MYCRATSGLCTVQQTPRPCNGTAAFAHMHLMIKGNVYEGDLLCTISHHWCGGSRVQFYEGGLSLTVSHHWRATVCRFEVNAICPTLFHTTGMKQTACRLNECHLSHTGNPSVTGITSTSELFHRLPSRQHELILLEISCRQVSHTDSSVQKTRLVP